MIFKNFYSIRSYNPFTISIFFYHQYYCNENLHPYSFFHLLNYFPKTQSQGYNYQKTLVNNDLTPAVSLNWIAHLLLLFLCEGSVIKVKLLASNLTSPQERMTWSQVTTGLQQGGSNLSNLSSARILCGFLGGQAARVPGRNEKHGVSGF